MTNVIDPREEVKKLQNLVRQLELQNAQLRSKQRYNKVKESSPPLRSSAVIRRRNSLTDRNDNVAKSSLDDVDIIDVNVLDLSEEDSWLFTSPKTLTDEEKSVSPYKWMRRDVEDPNNVELQTVKRALVNKLDEIARAHFTGIEHLRSPVRTFEDRESHLPHLKHSVGGYNRIDTRTFTRSKKRKDSSESKLPDTLKVHSLPESQSSPIDVGTPEDDCVSTASDSSFSLSSNAHRLADVVDVQTLARMQEESLQENSPLSSPRRSSAVPAHLPNPTSPPVHLDNVNKKNYEIKGKQNLKHIKSESLDNSLNSNQSENIVNPFYLNEESSHSGSFRRSLPNLSKHHGGLSVKNLSNCNSNPIIQNASESRLHNQESGNEDYASKESERDSRAPPRESRIPVHSQMRRDSSGSMSYSRSNSPGARSGIPQLRRSNSPADASPRTGVPKPVQRKIPVPRVRSSLPTRTSPSSLSHSSDESWKDGCF